MKTDKLCVGEDLLLDYGMKLEGIGADKRQNK